MRIVLNLIITFFPGFFTDFNRDTFDFFKQKKGYYYRL